MGSIIIVWTSFGYLSTSFILLGVIEEFSSGWIKDLVIRTAIFHSLLIVIVIAFYSYGCYCKILNKITTGRMFKVKEKRTQGNNVSVEWIDQNFNDFMSWSISSPDTLELPFSSYSKLCALSSWDLYWLFFFLNSSMSPCITNFLSTLSFSSLRTLFCNLRALFYSHPFLTRALLLFILVKTFEQNAAISLFGFCCSSLF